MRDAARGFRETLLRFGGAGVFRELIVNRWD
jgi:hypothetical protein